VDRANIFNPFVSRSEQHEDRLTWALLVAIKYDAALQRYLRDLVLSRIAEPLRSSMAREISLNWGAAEVSTQASRIAPSTSLVISVLISDEEIGQQLPVGWSDRKAVYDGVVEYADGVTLLLENKLHHGSVWKEQLSPSRSSYPGDIDEVTLVDFAVSVEWADVLEGILRYAESDLASFGAKEMAQDLLSLVDQVHPSLSPYNTFELCGGREEALNRRVTALLESLGRKADLEFRKRPGQEPYLLRPGMIAQELHLAVSRSGEVEPALRITVWPGDTVSQARRFYDAVDIKSFLSLEDQSWSVEPNFHFSFMATQLVWASTHLTAREYLNRFVGRPDSYGQRLTEEPALTPLLEEWRRDGLIDPAHEDEIRALFINTRRDHINVIPGFRVFRDWGMEEVIKWEQDNTLLESLIESVIEPLSTWGEDLHGEVSA
jgi:hypothetical protein